MGGMVVAVGSAKGSPGVTTLALALAACWPTGQCRPGPLLVEADPSGGDVAARFRLSEAPGLMDLAAAARREIEARVLGQCVQMLPGGPHVVVGPAGAQQAAAAVRLFAGRGVALLRAGMGTSGSVLLDVGRLQEETAALVQGADRLLLVTRGEVDALSHAAAKVDELRTAGGEAELVVVGSCPYPADEIRAVFGVPRVHTVPWDVKAARVLTGQVAVSSRGSAVAPLVRAARALAGSLNIVGDAATGASSAVPPGPRSTPDQMTAGVLGAGEVR